MKIVSPEVVILSHTENPELLIEAAGRTCYKSEAKITEESSQKFIENVVMSKGHESVMEHASASFRIVTNRFTTHQLVRHRIASYSQESQRYCNYSKDKFSNEISFVKPADIDPIKEPNVYHAWVKSCTGSELDYFEMLELGAKAQTARSVLNSSSKTEIVVTMNFRSWLHFIKLRASSHAQADIRAIAYSINKELNKIAPSIFKIKENNGEA
jgi:thymidylate synthase (FAD)